MNWLLDYIPWYVWLGLTLGGGGALLAFVPGALAAVVAIWNMLPGWARWALGGFVAALLAYAAGRNKGSRDERDKNKARADNAVRNRQEVDNEVRNYTPTQVDQQLKKHGDFREE